MASGNPLSPIVAQVQFAKLLESPYTRGQLRDLVVRDAQFKQGFHLASRFREDRKAVLV